MGKRGRTMYKTVDAEVEIEFEDILDYIDDYATEHDLKEIAEKLKDNFLEQQETPVDTLSDQMKYDLLMLAFKKYSLSELEEKLGTKFELM
jgi:predicted DNA-binding ArsR family transcriptional regulator